MTAQYIPLSSGLECRGGRVVCPIRWRLPAFASKLNPDTKKPMRMNLVFIPLTEQVLVQNHASMFVVEGASNADSITLGYATHRANCVNNKGTLKLNRVP